MTFLASSCHPSLTFQMSNLHLKECRMQFFCDSYPQLCVTTVTRNWFCVLFCVQLPKNCNKPIFSSNLIWSDPTIVFWIFHLFEQPRTHTFSIICFAVLTVVDDLHLPNWSITHTKYRNLRALRSSVNLIISFFFLLDMLTAAKGWRCSYGYFNEMMAFFFFAMWSPPRPLSAPPTLTPVYVCV